MLLTKWVEEWCREEERVNMDRKGFLYQVLQFCEILNVIHKLFQKQKIQ